MSLILYAYPGNINSQKALIAAAYGNQTIDYPPFNMGVENKTPEFLKKNPNGQVPTMDTPDGPIWESNAIARYVARKGDRGLLGANDYEASQVDQWIEWTRSRFDGGAVWNLIGPILGYKEFNQKEHDSALDQVRAAWGILEGQLSHRDYLVGNRVTLADIILFVTNSRLCQWVLTPEFRKSYPHVETYIQKLGDTAQFSKVNGKFAYATEELKPNAMKH